MSWRLASLVACFALACSSGKMRVKKGEPQTAREKMLAEEKAKSKGDGAAEEEVKPPGSKQWARWRYQGDRKECFFLVGRRCFKTEKAACAAAKCKAPSTCEIEGAGPAQLSCSGSKDTADASKSDKKSDDKKSDDKKSDDKKSDDKKVDDKKPAAKKPAAKKPAAKKSATKRRR